MTSRIILIVLMLMIAGCRLGDDGDDADRTRTLDKQAQDNQIEGSVIPEVGTGILLAMGMAATWATKRGWRF